MNILPMPRRDAATASGLSEQLLDLCRYGKPSVSLLGSGWHACVAMNTNTTGTSFEVRSEFGHKSPDAAVVECSARVHAALKTLTGK